MKRATRSDLIEYLAEQARGQKNVRQTVLDMLSELEDRSNKWSETVARVPDGGDELEQFFRKVESRVSELAAQTLVKPTKRPPERGWCIGAGMPTVSSKPFPEVPMCPVCTKYVGKPGHKVGGRMPAHKAAVSRRR